MANQEASSASKTSIFGRLAKAQFHRTHHRQSATVGLSPDGNITAQEHPVSDFSRPKGYFFSFSTVVAHN